MAIGKEFLELQERLGYHFYDIKYLQTALTHSSYSNEQKSRGLNFSSNERLEFLGDAVLQLVISEYLFENFKHHSEGALTKMRQHLVCEKTLSKIAREMNLGDYINLGRGEEMTDCRRRPKILADALEALLAAVYLDSVLSGSDYRAPILALFAEEIKTSATSPSTDAKTLLQQLVEKDGASILEYEITEESGPEHEKTFTVIAKINNNVVGSGTARSKKDAEMQAARAALRLFGVSV
ncbi:MAG: ribonuclease III [Clostridia bacterium]|nr:ribonuclease III [Clostridia bacterium]